MQCRLCCSFFFQAEDGIRDLVRSRGLGDVYKRQGGFEIGNCNIKDGWLRPLGMRNEVGKLVWN